MMHRCIMFFAVALSLPLAVASDFQKTYDAAADTRITILTLHGDIKLSGYDGKVIEISAIKNGPDRDRVEIENESSENHIHIFSRYPDPVQNNATVDFEIRVPKEIFYNTGPIAKPQGERVFNLNLQVFAGETPAPEEEPAHPKTPLPAKTPSSTKTPPTAKTPLSAKTSPPSGRGLQFPHSVYLKSTSGQITVSDVSGSMRLETGSRNIEVQNVEGMIYASSVSGDIKGILKQTSGHGMLQFSSISGNISMQAPDDISAQVRIQSSSGQVKTDFPLETREMRYGPGKFIQGILGAGNQMLDIRSVSGTITFSKIPSEAKSK